MNCHSNQITVLNHNLKCFIFNFQAFGKTKCIFIQNNTKKCLKKHKGCTDKSRHHRRLTENGTPKTIEELNERIETDNVVVDVKEHVCKNDPGMPEIDSAGDNKLIETEVREIEHQEDRKGRSKLTTDDAGHQSEALLEGEDHDNDSNTDKETENVDSSKLGEVNYEGSGNTGKCEQEVEEDSKFTETTNSIRNKAELEKGSGLEVKIENSVHSRSDDEKRGRDFYKPYYTMKKIKPSTKRQNSIKIASEQSIYQHFTMTKRQLSLDSALEECNHKNVTNSGVDFPFPVHSINQHKIQAGVKLGLYDQHALEKLETMKPRKSARKRLPSLNVE